MKGTESTSKTLADYNAEKIDGGYKVGLTEYTDELVALRGVAEIHRTVGSKEANAELQRLLKSKASENGLSIVEFIKSL